MRFNSGSSIKNNAYSSSSASSNTNEKLKKLNEELDQLELLVSGMQTSLSSVNSKIGTDTVADQIAVAKTEIENAIGQEVVTQKVTAPEADIDTIVSNILRADSITPSEADSIDVSAEVKVPSIKLNDSITSVSTNSDIRVPDGAIAWIGSNLVINKGNGNALIFSKTGDISYSISDNNILINANDSVSVSYIYRDSPVEVVAHESASYTSVNSGLTVVGSFYADLTAATFQNITISNTLTAKDVTAENISVSEDVNVTGTVTADKVESNSAYIEEIESDTITSDRINSSQIHTKIDKENIGYTTVQEHQDTEEYAIGIPITNGLWEIELEGYIKATINKTNSAVLITYWRESESALTRVGVKDGVFYFYTRRSGKLYFSNNTLEVNDTTVSVNAPNDPGYPVPETLDKEINIVTNEGVIATETMVVDNLIVTGDFTIKDFTADKVAVRTTDDDQDFNVTFTAPLPNPEQEEVSNNYIYGDSDLKYNPTSNTLGTGSIKVEKDIKLVDSVDAETEEVTYSSGEAYQYLSVSCAADGETLRAHWEDAATTISCENPKLTSSQTIAAYNGKTAENTYPITHLGTCTKLHGNMGDGYLCLEDARLYSPALYAGANTVCKLMVDGICNPKIYDRSTSKCHDVASWVCEAPATSTWNSVVCNNGVCKKLTTTDHVKAACVTACDTVLACCHLESRGDLTVAGEASISCGLCANTVTANCFCGKATCADIADVACTVCVNGVSGLRPILTVGSDGKIYNTGDNVQAGSRCIVTPLVSTGYIYADGDYNDLTLISSKYCEEYSGPYLYSCIFYDPFSIQSVQCDLVCDSEIRFHSGHLQGAYIGQTGLCMCYKENSGTTSSCFILNKDCTCYHRADYNNNDDVYNDIIMTCTGEISISTCMCPTNSITGKGCLDLGICGNTLYSKSCLNDQYNRLIQDCTGTLICTYRSGSTYCPTTLQICFNGIKTNAKNNTAESYLSEKPNSFILHTCDTTNCKTGSIEVDSNSGYILHCTCNGNCGRVNFSQNGVTFIQNNTSSTIVGDQFSGNAATATNAVNSTCFNDCTYSEACTDIRNGLATQACANAIQNCANFIQSCVTAIENKIPAQASSSNQLADKAFVNSSITTNTANFRGTYACVAELPSTGNTNNDYAFVCSLNTTTGNYIYDRYKWVASSSSWVCEYEINTTGFTAEQLASINSGITSNLVSKITDVYDNTVTVCMNGVCKCSFSLNQNTNSTINLGCDICNAKCFDGCTYACAKADIRNGLISDIGVKVYCGTTCRCTLAKASNLCLSANAFNANATISTTTYPGACCTGTVTSVNVSVNGCSGTAVTSSGTVTLTNVPTCIIYKTMATANTNRNVLLGEASETAGYGCVYVGNSCKLTFNPGTGVLTATCVKGSTSVIAGNPTSCTSTQAGVAGTTVGCGAIELFGSNPLIDFHVNNACADCSHRIIANLGNLQVVATNASGCKAATQSANFSFNSDGTFRSTSLCTDRITTGEIKASESIFLGAECDVCIYDACGNNFICGYGCSLTIGYGSDSFERCNYCRITVGLNNILCDSKCEGCSVVTGFDNQVYWTNYNLSSLIYGHDNATRDGGLAVGGWNIACGDCSVVLGWDSHAVDCSIAIGTGAWAGANASIAIGCEACAMCSESIAIGCENCAKVGYGLVIGYESYASAYGTACVNSSIRKGPLREITVTWCDSTLRCDIWKAIACNLDLRKNGKGTVLTSGCTYLNATGSAGTNVILGHICNYDYNSSLATMCSILFSNSCGDDRMTISATCTATAASSGGDGGGFLTVTGWAI